MENHPTQVVPRPHTWPAIHSAPLKRIRPQTSDADADLRIGLERVIRADAGVQPAQSDNWQPVDVLRDLGECRSLSHRVRNDQPLCWTALGVLLSHLMNRREFAAYGSVTNREMTATRSWIGGGHQRSSIALARAVLIAQNAGS